jgi:hypothetical protein
MKTALLAVALLISAATSSWACGNAYTKCCVTHCYGGTCETTCN